MTHPFPLWLRILIGIMVVPAVVVAVTEPLSFGRLPQAAPSLSRSAPSLASRLGPDGLQSTIAGEK